MAKVPFNTTIPEDVRDGIKALAVDGKSQGDVVTEAYRALTVPKSDLLQKVYERVGRIENMVEEMVENGGEPSTRHPRVSAAGFDPASVPGIIRGPVGRYPCRCVHSGCRGAKFQGVTKFANLCFDCMASGHVGNPADCQECFSDTGPA